MSNFIKTPTPPLLSTASVFFAFALLTTVSLPVIAWESESGSTTHAEMMARIRGEQEQAKQNQETTQTTHDNSLTQAETNNTIHEENKTTHAQNKENIAVHKEEALTQHEANKVIHEENKVRHEENKELIERIKEEGQRDPAEWCPEDKKTGPHPDPTPTPDPTPNPEPTPTPEPEIPTEPEITPKNSTEEPPEVLTLPAEEILRDYNPTTPVLIRTGGF